MRSSSRNSEIGLVGRGNEDGNTRDRGRSTSKLLDGIRNREMGFGTSRITMSRERRLRVRHLLRR